MLTVVCDNLSDFSKKHNIIEKCLWKKKSQLTWNLQRPKKWKGMVKEGILALCPRSHWVLSTRLPDRVSSS